MNYRESHASAGYGRVYSKTYEKGYYAAVWRDVEKPLVENILRSWFHGGARSYLDFACGTGRVLAVGAEIFPRAVGVDVSEAMLEVARERCANAICWKRDITLDPLDERFDVVSSFRFFLNAEPALRQAALKAIHRSLVDGGHLLVNVHVNASSPLGLAYRLRNQLRGRTIANTLGQREFSTFLQNAGFEIDAVRFYGLYPRSGPWFDKLAEVMVPRTEVAFERFQGIPRSWAQGFLVLARKGS